ncbi:MAG TPA: 2-phosphosulfolactate phosphatase [Longimicrobium sp.]|jgi:2-phosphosulfolactate phosphatase
MKLDVLLTPGELMPGDIAERTVVVIDVLRASSTIVQALAAGARALFPVASIEEALRLANTLGRDEVLLCGERKSLPIEGFDLGNSPGDFTAERVGGKTLVMSTTNGTGAMMAAAAASRVVVGSFLNLQAVVDELVRTGAEPVFLCSGRETKFGLEDAVCAGKMASTVMEAVEGDWELNDGALAALALAERYGELDSLFSQVAAGKQIVEAGLSDDLAFCARTDSLDVVPVLHDRQISLAPAAAVEG